MNKNLNLMAVLVVALLTGLAPVRMALAAPFGQMRLPGNYSPHFTRVSGTVLNTQTRLGNLGGSLASSQAIRSLGAIQTTRIPAFDRITQIAPPVASLDATWYLHSVDGLARRPDIVASMPSLYEVAFQAIPDRLVNKNDGNGNGHDNGGDGDDNGGSGEDGGKGSKDGGSSGGKGGGGSGYSPPKPPALDYLYYVDDDDDDERERMARMYRIIQIFESQVK